MTNEEALNRLIHDIQIDLRYTKDFNADYECLMMCANALEKQIPKKPIKDRRYTKELCPVCNDFVRLYAGTPMLFCCNCGQALDWSNEA